MTEAHSDSDSAPRTPWPRSADAGPAARHNVISALDALADARGDATALRWAEGPVVCAWRTGRRSDLEHRTLSVGELQRRVAAAANGLRAFGVERGDRVMIQAAPSPELAVAVLACQRLGALPVLIDGWGRAGLVERCAAEVEPRAFVGPSSAYGALAAIPSLRDVTLRLTLGADHAPALTDDLIALSRREYGCPIAPVAEDDGALLVYSTETGTLSDGVLHTHRSLRAQAELFGRLLPPQPGEVDLSVSLPLVLARLLRGVPVVLPCVDLVEPDEYDGQALVEQMRSTATTSCLLTPALLRSVVASASRRVELVPSLRRVCLSGPPLCRDDVVALEMVLPRAELHTLYGSRFAEPIAHLRGREAPVGSERGTPVGSLCSGVEARLLRHPHREGTAQWAEPGEPGELVVRAEHVCSTFSDGRGTQAFVLDDAGERWHRTGDVVHLAANQTLSVLGAAAATICRAGRLVFNLRAETLMNRLPSVRASALVGMPDQTLGEKVVAVVKASRAAAGEQVEGDVRRVLERGGVPVDEIVLVETISLDGRRHPAVELGRLRSMLERSES